MASLTEREFIISEIAKLQQQQLTAQQKSNGNRNPEQSLVAFDRRFARIAWLVRLLADLDEFEYT